MVSTDEGAMAAGLTQGAQRIDVVDDFWLPVIADLAAGYVREILAEWPESQGASAGFQSLASEIVMMAVACRVAPALSEVLPDHDASDIGQLDVDDPDELVSSAGSVLRQVWALMGGSVQGAS